MVSKALILSYQPLEPFFIPLFQCHSTMNDLFEREKFAHLPRAISEAGQRTRTYEVGDVSYWSPGRDVAIFYRQDGQQIPAPGLIPIGKLEAGVEAFNVPGSVNVTVELSDKDFPNQQHKE